MIYVTRAGDTLQSIADKIGTTRNQIALLNPSVYEPLMSGQNISVPNLPVETGFSLSNLSTEVKIAGALGLLAAIYFYTKRGAAN